MDLDKLVGELGVTVTTGPLPNGWWGAYSASTHTITLRPRLGALQRRSTLFHELGHAYYRHDKLCIKAERQASVWAARRLIKQSAFIDACRVARTAQGIAHILGVLPRDVENYRTTLTPAEALLLRQIIAA
jgi:hypothetical protein